jgi:hypothetical protein
VKVLCLICSEKIVVLEVHNAAKHYSSKQKKKKYKNCVGAQGTEKAAALKKGASVTMECLQKKSTDNSSTLQTSYYVAHVR